MIPKKSFWSQPKKIAILKLLTNSFVLILDIRSHAWISAIIFLSAIYLVELFFGVVFQGIVKRQQTLLQEGSDLLHEISDSMQKTRREDIINGSSEN